MKTIMNNKGFGLAETVIALFLLTLAITTALALSDHVSKLFAKAKVEMMATSYATEGIELVRNMRDTNWLQFGEGSARERWGAIIPAPLDDPYEDVSLNYASGNYVVTFCTSSGPDCKSPTQKQFTAYLQPVTDIIDPPHNDERLRLWQEEVVDETDNARVVKLTNQYPEAPSIATPVDFGFSRIITVRYLEDNEIVDWISSGQLAEGDVANTVDQSLYETSNAMLVTSKVMWKTQILGIKREVVVETLLTDWFKRKNHDDV